MKHEQRKRVVSFGTVAVWAWTVMTVTHELGHVLAGLLSGARLVQLELRPWHLPHSHFVADRFPLITVWAGPVLGSLVPLMVASVIKRQSVWFVAWFCLLANGGYLLLGLFSDGAELDTNKMIRAGTPTIVVAIIAAVASTLGYWKFRKACVAMLSPNGATMNRRHLVVSAGGWLLCNAILSVPFFAT